MAQKEVIVQTEEEQQSKKGGPKFNRIRRITGYLTGDLSRWNDAKKAEEKDRVKHN